jgi:hypothetical protein
MPSRAASKSCSSSEAVSLRIRKACVRSWSPLLKCPWHTAKPAVLPPVTPTLQTHTKNRGRDDDHDAEQGRRHAMGVEPVAICMLAA